MFWKRFNFIVITNFLILNPLECVRLQQFELERYTGYHPITVPAFSAFMTGSTFKIMAGPRVAALAGTLGLGAVGLTYGVYTAMGIPHGSRGFLFL